MIKYNHKNIAFTLESGECEKQNNFVGDAIFSLKYCLFIEMSEKTRYKNREK